MPRAGGACREASPRSSRHPRADGRGGHLPSVERDLGVAPRAILSGEIVPAKLGRIAVLAKACDDAHGPYRASRLDEQGRRVSFSWSHSVHCLCGGLGSQRSRATTDRQVRKDLHKSRTTKVIQCCPRSPSRPRAGRGWLSRRRRDGPQSDRRRGFIVSPGAGARSSGHLHV